LNEIHMARVKHYDFRRFDSLLLICAKSKFSN